MKRKGTLADPGILVVDDHPDTRRLLEHIFVRAGMRVHCAEDGAAALAKLRERRFLYLLTDFHMPGMDGLELSRKAREIIPELEIVLETADDSQDLQRQAHAHGIETILIKPFTVKTIKDLARRWWQKPEAPL